VIIVHETCILKTVIVLNSAGTLRPQVQKRPSF